MNRVLSKIACYLVPLVLLGAGGTGRAAEAARPSSVSAAVADARTAEALTILRRVAEKKPLRLTTEGERPQARFHFVIRLSMEPPGAAPQYTEYLVIKNGARVGVLVRSLDGLPYCYLTEGLMVMVDREEPGRFLLHTRGAPSVVFRMSEEEGKLDFWVSHVRRAAKGMVDLDLGPVLKLAVDKLRQATFEHSTGRLVGQTDRSGTMMTLPAAERPGDFGLRSFVNRVPGGQTLAVLDPTTGGEPILDIGRVTKETVAALGLPVREVPDTERGEIPLIVPKGYGADPKERDAAMKLLSLLASSDVPGTQPTK